MKNEVVIDNHLFRIDERSLVICGVSEPDRPLLTVRFSPEQAYQLSQLLDLVVPEEYGVRGEFRIPVNDVVGVKVKVVGGACPLDIEPVSLSMSGLFAQFRRHPPHPPELNSRLMIELNFENQAVSLPAVVTRSTGDGVGLMFVLDKSIERRNQLADLVMSVQRKWIANCAR